MEPLSAAGHVFDASCGPDAGSAAPAGALAGVLVSNGEHVVRTDSGGRFVLPVEPGTHRFVTVTVPARFRAAEQRWYYPTAGWQRSRDDADFPLLPAPERAAPPFRLLHISDTHVIAPETDLARADAIAQTPGGADTPGEALWRRLQLSMQHREFPSRDEFAAALQRAAAVAAPDFIVATGDLTHAGTVEQLEHYREAIATSPVPLFSIFGGHDGNQERVTKARGAGFSRQYEGVLGPAWYSFEWGGWHFAVWAIEDGFFSPADLRSKERWLEADLAQQPADRPVALLLHSTPPATLLAGLRARHPGLQLVLHGHTHCSKVWRHSGIAVMEAPSFSFGGIDTRPAGYRTVDFAEDSSYVSRLEALPATTRTAADATSPLPSPARGRAAAGGPWSARHAWTWRAPAPIHRAAPVVAGDVVLVSVADESYPGRPGVVALDRASGRERWTLVTDSAVKNTVSVTFGAAPGAGGGSSCFAASVGGRVYAVDVSSGTALWQADLPGFPDRWIAESPAAGHGVVYCGGRGGCTALDGGSGATLWHTTFGSSDPKSHVAPLVWNDLLLVPRGTLGMAALRRADGAIAWQCPVPLDHHGARPVLSGDVALCGDRTGALVALDAASGAVLWRLEVCPTAFIAGIAVHQDRVTLTTSGGLIVCLESSSREVLWQAETGPDLLDMIPYRRGRRSLLSAPVVRDGEVLAGAGDGWLHVLDAATGRLLERVWLGAPISASPFASREGFGVATYDGGVHWFGTNAS